MGQLRSKDAGTDGTPKGDSMEPQRRRLRFLIVDDDDLNRNMMELMLAPQGFELEFACDGAEALDAIKSHAYDLVFMDLVLPDMSGRDVTRLVREWEAGKQHLPIVAVTAYDMPGQPIELIKAGMDDYIFKPYDLRGLMRIIELYAGGDGPEASGAGGAGKLISMPEAPVLDSASILIDFSHDIEGYKQLLNDFVATLPSRLDRMIQAHEAGDFERLDRECHTLKGVSAGLGAMRLSRIATHLGRSCTDGRQTSAGPLLQEMEQAITEVQAEARAFIGS